ncbi:MAG: hypothetical protein WA213_04970 [Terriglobales bacterium]
MNPEEEKDIAKVIESIFQAQKLLTNAFWQLSGRFDALKAIVCELHPEVATRLEDRIRTEQNESLRQFEEIQQKLALILPTLSKSTH